MLRRFATIFSLHMLALGLMSLGYAGVADSRPMDSFPLVQAGPEPGSVIAVQPGSMQRLKIEGQNLSAIPLAEPVPSAGSVGPAEIGVGTRKFNRPGIEGVRLDWCSDGQTGCGPPAAVMFCQWQGFKRAVSMIEEQGVGLKEPTRQIGGTECAGPTCSGFLTITCTQS